MWSKIFIFEFFSSFLRLFDVLFSLTVVCPLVLIYWATTWKIGDIFLTPNEPLKSATISFSIGFSGQFFLLFFQDFITKSLKFKNNKCVNLLVSKVYALIVAQTCIHFWRGVWMFIDFVSSPGITSMFINLIQNLTILSLSKSLKNLLASPFVLLVDKSDGDYSAATFFKTKVEEFLKFLQYFALFLVLFEKADGSFTFVIDCICTLMIAAVVVYVWRDIWTLTDVFMAPVELEVSAYASIVSSFSKCFFKFLTFLF